MPVRQYANAPATSLANSCTALATSIVVTATTGFPITYPYTLIIDRGTATEEAVSVTAAASTTLTVTRGIDSTTAFAHVQGASVAHGITAQDIREANAHVNANAGVHGVVGSVVGTTDTQTLTNKTLTSPTLTSPTLTGNPIGPTPATSDNDTSLATTAFVKAVLLAANPVGSIAFNTTGTNPSTYIGGTWTAWGSGRVPVGVDAGQSEFNVVEETGGAKTHTLTIAEMPVHGHGVTDPGHVHRQTIDAGYNTANGGPAGLYGQNNSGDSAAASGFNTFSAGTGISIQNNGGGGAHNNLQPYITCYMFKRTA